MQSKMTRGSLWALGVLAIVLSQAGAAYATQTPVPEINASAVSAGLAALAGAVLILRSWRR